MADRSVIPLKSDLADVYNETNYFINAIVSDYGLYVNFIDSLKAGKASFGVVKKKYKKEIDNAWVEVIENSLSSLDFCIRNPMKEIVEQEDVLPIELSRNITSRSLRHLAQHTNFINKIDEDGTIIPSKILNVFHDESVLTYENKFINTLVQRLFDFVNRRYSQLSSSSGSQSSVSMDFSAGFRLGNSTGKINFSMEVGEDKSTSKLSLDNRVERLHGIVIQYIDSPFIKSMGQNVIHPPVMRTNAIMKNKDLRQCLILWEFIESYDKIGYTISVEESAERPNDSYIESLYSLLSLQYMMFKFNLEHDFNLENLVLDKKSTDRPMAPSFMSKLKDIEVDDYNVYDSEYRRVVPVSQLGKNRRLSKSEMRVRQAIDDAFAADKFLAGERKKAARAKARG